MDEYLPERGDVVWISLNPQAGHEQAGRRPALVLSPRSYNAKVGLALMCLITQQVKGYPFEVLLPQDAPIQGVVLSIRSNAWTGGRARSSTPLPCRWSWCWKCWAN